MRDRVAIHKLVDRVLDELDEGKNFVHLDISTYTIGLRAQSNGFDSEKPYDINTDCSIFTMDDADLLIKKLDAIADANPHD